MSKGVVVLVPFPFTDLSGQKVRPALVLFAPPRGEDCIVAFISSVLHKKTETFDVLVKSSARNGLKTDSRIRLDKLATLQKKVVIGELGALESSFMTTVDKKLKSLFRL